MRPFYIFIVIIILGLASIPAGILAFDWFSPIRNTGLETRQSADCEEHGLASGHCPFCDPRLIETEGFCAEHGVPEALCHRCRPEMEAVFRKTGDWCGGHNIPESQCERCNPGILDKYRGGDAPGGMEPLGDDSSFFDDFDTKDSFPRYKRSPSPGCTTQDQRIIFSDAAIPLLAGIATTPAISMSLAPELKCDVVTDYDRNAYTRIFASAAGIIRQVAVDLGSVVNQGDTLAVVDSEEFGAAKTGLLEAYIRLGQLELNYDRAERLFEKQITSEKDMLEARARLEQCRIQIANAKQRLKNLGLTEKDIRRVHEEKDTASLLSILSPLSGVVVQRSAVHGERVSSSQPLFDIVPIDKMWALLNVYEPDLAKIKRGQRVIIQLAGVETGPVEGVVSWISTEIDPATRTLRVRAEVENGGGRIKAGMFGSARIQMANSARMTGIPVDAVQWDGCCNMAFVRVNEREYVPRKVKIRFRNNAYYALESGINPGEAVVTQGSFLLKTEILKKSIGAGCCPES